MVGAVQQARAVTFDGSYDGFLCVIFAHYYDGVQPMAIQTQSQLTLFADDALHIETCAEKAARVARGLRNKISEDAAGNVYYAFHSGDEGRFAPLFEYVKLGFKLGHMIDSHLHEDCVRAVHKLARHVGREAHLLYGFCRFAETTNGVFYCVVTPKNDVLHFLANHFSQRFMNQQWIIHDKHRNMAAVYDGREYIITGVPHNTAVEYAEGEDEIQELWVTFFTTLAIEARKNPKLQRQLLPLYFRKNMTEFTKI